MQLEEKQVLIRKLIASPWRVLREKQIQYDEEGKEIPRETFKEVYLAKDASPDLYEEIDKIQE